MLTTDQKAKLYKKYKKLADFIVENNVTKGDILDLMVEDFTFQRHRDIVGQATDYFEWRVHPHIPKISCSTQGDISIAGTAITPVEYGGELKIIIDDGRKKMSAAALVLGTFVPMPDDGGVYTPRYRNNNFRDLRICNLYWYKLVT